MRACNYIPALSRVSSAVQKWLFDQLLDALTAIPYTKLSTFVAFSVVDWTEQTNE